MKAYPLCLLALILTLTSVGFAQSNSDTTGVDGANTQQSGGRELHIDDGARSKMANVTLIKGRCVMVKSAENPIGGYCANVPLILFDESGKSVAQLRTDLKGQFEVNVDDANAKYRFGPSSPSYEIEGATKLVQGGGHALIRLKIKK